MRTNFGVERFFDATVALRTRSSSEMVPFVLEKRGRMEEYLVFINAGSKCRCVKKGEERL